MGTPTGLGLAVIVCAGAIFVIKSNKAKAASIFRSLWHRGFI
jgi:hypothetical protein